MLRSLLRLVPVAALSLVPLLAFIAAETMLTTRWLARPQQRLLSRTQYRLAELVFLLLLIRFLTWIIGDVNPEPHAGDDHI